MNTTKKIKLIDFKLKKAIWNLLFSTNKSKFFWSWLDFLKHKEYEFWDSVKNINWKIFSKTEKLYSKIFEEEKEKNVLFLIDLSSDLSFWSEKISKKDLFEEVFYTLSLSSHKSLDNFACFCFTWKENKFFSYKKDFSNIFQTIEYIEKFAKNTYRQAETMENILDFLVKKNITDNLIFVLSDFIFEKDSKNLKILSLKNEIIYINIFDEIENTLTQKNKNFVFNSWKKFLEIDFLNNKKIEKFNNLRKEKLRNFATNLQKNNIWYIYIDSSKNSFLEITNYFSKI